MKRNRIWIWRGFLWTAIFAAVLDGRGSAAKVERDLPVAVRTTRWVDPERRREIPVKIYHPEHPAGRFPVILFSHGLGGTREGYEYLGREWARRGYVSIHLQHPGSDDAVWRTASQPVEAMRRAAANPLHAWNRVRDVKFALDQVEQMDRRDPILKGHLAIDRIGLAGHSFGAWTTLAAIGQRSIGRRDQERGFGDPRIKAAIPMSAPVPSRSDQFDRVYQAIAVPCLHMTGTLDYSPIGNTGPEQRRIPFDHIHRADQYLVTFVGGDHMIFSGRRFRWTRRASDQDALFQELIRRGTTAFWDAYLKNDSRAKAWLADGGYEKALGHSAKFEKKTKESK